MNSSSGNSNLVRQSESLPQTETGGRTPGLLIVNADDLGNDEATSSKIMHCHLRGRISSASAMVFMDHSEEAAQMALEWGLEVGLHLSFTEPLSGLRNKPLLARAHSSIAGFLSRTRRLPLYNPLLRREFEYVCRAQYEEFHRLYGRAPSHVDGHHHMHLCANMMMDRFIPAGSLVRRSFDFFRGEKSSVNRLYRRLLNKWVTRNFISTDYFFDLYPMSNDRLVRILALSRACAVELMVHPGNQDQLEYLLGDEFYSFLTQARMGNWENVGEEASAPFSRKLEQ